MLITIKGIFSLVHRIKGQTPTITSGALPALSETVKIFFKHFIYYFHEVFRLTLIFSFIINFISDVSIFTFPDDTRERSNIRI